MSLTSRLESKKEKKPDPTPTNRFIPMRGMIQSLNLSVASAICLNEITRQVQFGVVYGSGFGGVGGWSWGLWCGRRRLHVLVFRHGQTNGISAIVSIDCLWVTKIGERLGLASYGRSFFFRVIVVHFFLTGNIIASFPSEEWKNQKVFRKFV